MRKIVHFVLYLLAAVAVCALMGSQGFHYDTWQFWLALLCVHVAYLGGCIV